MQKIKFRYLQHLFRNKTSLIILLLLFCTAGKGQLRDSWNLENHDEKPYYFGIVLGYNTSHYNLTHAPYFLANDTIIGVESQNSGRIHLGILVNWQISNRWDLRFYPLDLIFSEKKLLYTQKYPNQGDNSLDQFRKVESIVMSFPLQARLKSDRINNFRVYALAGVKFDYDLASNSGATNSEDFIKVKKTDYGVEMGVGFQFFFKYFIFSPELKVSQGLTNVHIPDQANKYSDVIDQMKSRMIMFSLQFEGGGSN
jgi:opacity protein-like surface antigen